MNESSTSYPRVACPGLLRLVCRDATGEVHGPDQARKSPWFVPLDSLYSGGVRLRDATHCDPDVADV
jgi:hypothetical protein